MLPEALRRRPFKRSLLLLAPLILSGCSSIGDLGLVDRPAVADNIHAWVGQEAALHAGAPISLNNLTEDERTLRDLAFPLIQPPYDRERWDAVVFEYGEKRDFRRNLWVVDPAAYYGNLWPSIIARRRPAITNSTTTSATTSCASRRSSTWRAA